MRARPLLVALIFAVAATGATCKGNDKPAPTVVDAAPTPHDSEAALASPEITEIPGFDISSVPPASRLAFWRIMNETFCYCGCTRTLAACLANRTDCNCVQCAERMSRFITDEFRGGASVEQVELTLLEGFAEGYHGAERPIEAEGHAVLGSADARFTLVEFADFRCGHCRQAAPVLKKLVEQRKDVRVVYFYFPLGATDSPSMEAAEAAEEARVQGKFWEMSALLFEHQATLDRAKLFQLAEKVGLDPAKFKTAIESHVHRDKIQADKNLGMKLGVKGTPAFFVNGRPFGFEPSLEYFQLRLDMEAERGPCR